MNMDNINLPMAAQFEYERFCRTIDSLDMTPESFEELKKFAKHLKYTESWQRAFIAAELKR
jgi:hypothetical protein